MIRLLTNDRIVRLGEWGQSINLAQLPRVGKVAAEREKDAQRHHEDAFWSPHGFASPSEPISAHFGVRGESPLWYCSSFSGLPENKKNTKAAILPALQSARVTTTP